jgi:hypothetical protein
VRRSENNSGYVQGARSDDEKQERASSCRSAGQGAAIQAHRAERKPGYPIRLDVAIGPAEQSDLVGWRVRFERASPCHSPTVPEVTEGRLQYRRNKPPDRST